MKPCKAVAFFVAFVFVCSPIGAKDVSHRIFFSAPVSASHSLSVKGTDKQLETKGSPQGITLVYEPFYNIGFGAQLYNQVMNFGGETNPHNTLEYQFYLLTYRWKQPDYVVYFGLGTGNADVKFSDASTDLSGSGSPATYFISGSYRFDTALDFHLTYQGITSFTAEVEAKDDDSSKSEVSGSGSVISIGMTVAF